MSSSCTDPIDSQSESENNFDTSNELYDRWNLRMTLLWLLVNLFIQPYQDDAKWVSKERGGQEDAN